MAPLTLDGLHLIALLGALQGLFLAGVLAMKPSNRTANRLLAALIFAFSIHLTTTVYHAAGLVHRFPHFFGVGYPMLFVYGPLLYLYTVAASDRSHRFTRADALHFVPFLLVVLESLPNYLLGGADKVALLQQIQRGELPTLLKIVGPLRFVSGISYVAVTVMYLLRHRERVKESYSSVERVNLKWLLWLGAAAAAIWALALVFNLVESAGILQLNRDDDIVSLAIAIVVYGIGYMGLRQPEIFRFETAEYAVPAAVRESAQNMSVQHESAPHEPAQEEPSYHESPGPRYERSGLTDRQAARLKDALTSVMESERPWRDSELTLADLSERLATTPHKLSEVLNSQLRQTFYDFVNSYRVREVQRRIAAGEGERIKILALALDAGFASKSTFNAVFKKHTNQTPSTYRHSANV